METVGLLGAGTIVLASGEHVPPADAVAAAAVAGAAGVLGLGVFYRALAIGTMSVVAPISATGAALPVVVGIATGERPAAIQIAGMAAAFTGVLLAAREAHEDAERAAAGRASVALALLSAVGFGGYFVGIDAASGESVLWAMLVTRLVAVPALLTAVLVTRGGVAPAPAVLPSLALIGVFDLAATGLYTAATAEGLLSVVAVLGSLYPVTTVLLARLVLGERVRRVQEVGIVAALAGVALIAAG